MCVKIFTQVRQFEAAARAAPGDADLQVALGVLHNLSRNFDGAEAAFRAALSLRPGDYSLWNKLGAWPALKPEDHTALEKVSGSSFCDATLTCAPERTPGCCS